MPARTEAAARTLYLAACFASIAFLGFVAGGLATLGETYPGRILEDAYRAGKAYHDKLTLYNEPLQFDFWRVARTEASGVTVYRPEETYNGYTLYTSGHGQRAFLVDMEGHIVHE
jgi:hypothetical protein